MPDTMTVIFGIVVLVLMTSRYWGDIKITLHRRAEEKNAQRLSTEQQRTASGMGVQLAAVLVVVGLAFLAAALSKLFGPKPDIAVALELLAIASVYIGLFFFIRSERRRDDRFLRWLSENGAAIEGGGARYRDILITPGTTLTRYEVALSFLVVSFKVPSRLYIVGHDATLLVATAFTVISLLLGWWGVPWGPIYTVRAVWSNVRGGATRTLPELLRPAPA